MLALWPALLPATLATFGLAAGGASIAPVDRIELEHPPSRSVADAMPARRTRQRAVRLAGATGALVFLMPWAVLLLLRAPDAFDLEGRPWWPSLEIADPWALAAGLGLPWIASVLGSVIGSRRGKKFEQERWSGLDPGAQASRAWHSSCMSAS